MHDYATVFGVEGSRNDICYDTDLIIGLLKTSREISSACVYEGSKSTPYTAQFRIQSSSHTEVFGIVVEALRKVDHISLLKTLHESIDSGRFQIGNNCPWI